VPDTGFEDWRAIRELTAAYNDSFDRADAEGWAATFVPTGRLHVAPDGLDLTGREELARFCESRGPGFVHMTFDPRVSIDGDEAVQVCSLLMFRRHADRSTPTLLTTGRYHDELVRTAGGWRFAVRHIELHAPIAAAPTGALR
jgi:hypothetical protein